MKEHSESTIALEGLPELLKGAAEAASAFVEAAGAGLAQDSGANRADMDRNQHVLHGFAWYAAHAAMMREVAGWLDRIERAGQSRAIDRLLAQLLVSECCAQLSGGVPMGQGEVIRPYELTDDAGVLALLDAAAVRTLARSGATQAVKFAIARALARSQGQATLENCGLDETLTMVRDQFFAFSREKILPHAHEWHLANALIPLTLIGELGRLGVFGLTIPETYGGLGMGKTAMCVVSEELSRGWIGVGSLGTRSEIAAELILLGGSQEQMDRWLPAIASGELLPTAVFTEPDTGSDLGSLRTRAVLEDDHYRVFGNKTWITHGARADLMTLLVRTDPATHDYRGLSLLIASKPRGSEDDPFPATGMDGSEIGVIGYRGMREYEIAFDGFRVPSGDLLGGREGQGFKQLMATFESARIQTAARAVGVAQAALDAALAYALSRKQFGRPIFDFPRVANKLAIMAAEIMGARQLTYFAARRKDEGRRCDLEAGMAKLINARVAWSAADMAVQIHGGNGFAVEYPASRLLADARILNIFEGAGEIQAQVIARRLIEDARASSPSAPEAREA